MFSFSLNKHCDVFGLQRVSKNTLSGLSTLFCESDFKFLRFCLIRFKCTITLIDLFLRQQWQKDENKIFLLLWHFFNSSERSFKRKLFISRCSNFFNNLMSSINKMASIDQIGSSFRMEQDQMFFQSSFRSGKHWS